MCVSKHQDAMEGPKRKPQQQNDPSGARHGAGRPGAQHGQAVSALRCDSCAATEESSDAGLLPQQLVDASLASVFLISPMIATCFQAQSAQSAQPSTAHSAMSEKMLQRQNAALASAKANLQRELDDTAAQVRPFPCLCAWFVPVAMLC